MITSRDDGDLIHNIVKSIQSKGLPTRLNISIYPLRYDICDDYLNAFLQAGSQDVVTAIWEPYQRSRCVVAGLKEHIETFNQQTQERLRYLEALLLQERQKEATQLTQINPITISSPPSSPPLLPSCILYHAAVDPVAQAATKAPSCFLLCSALPSSSLSPHSPALPSSPAHLATAALTTGIPRPRRASSSAAVEDSSSPCRHSFLPLF
ncbi:hypothetical protein M0R45_033485 [Rubus argutus]|uniref:Uncharacterized protein n=1 Tax=Rubus argutus TaxID=59490 RepID=A0AAW1WM93_RUBAR